MTIEEKNRKITEKMDDLKLSFEHGTFWSHDYGTANDPSKVSNTEPTHVVLVNAKGEEYKPHYTSDGSCGCNCFNSAIQCHGFALYMAYRLFGTRLYISDKYTGETNKVIENSGGWVVHTQGNLDGISLEPGDIIRSQDPKHGWHTGIVWKTDGNVVYFAEVWGSQGSKIAWGGWNGRDVSDTETQVDALKSRALYIVKSPKTVYEGELDPNPDDDTIPDTEGTKVPVTFKKNTESDGGPVAETREYTAGSQYGSFPDVSRENYIQDGWYSEYNVKKDSSLYTETTEVPAYSHTLYAHWKYKLRLHKNDGTDTVVESTKYAHTCDTYGTVLSDEDIPRSGYSITGWKFANGNDCNMDNVVDNVTRDLYAQWTAISFTVTVNANGGTCSVSSFSATHGTAYGENFPANDPTREGYDFKGWYSDTAFTNPVDENTIADISKKNIYAKWSAKNYSVSLYPGYGTNVQISGEHKVETGEKYGDALPTLTRCGYDHIGWEGTDGNIYTSESTVTKEIIKFTAKWEAKEMDVLINYNMSGIGGMNVPNVEYGSDYGEKVLKEDSDAKIGSVNGYTFKGWYLPVVDKDTAVRHEENHTLTAMWEPVEYNVSFVSGDCEFAEDVPDIKVKYGEKYGCLPVPKSNKHYVFSFWSYDDPDDLDNYGNVCTGDTDVIVAGNHTLKANWNKTTYVKFKYTDSEGNECERGISQEYGIPYRGVPDLPEVDHAYTKWIFVSDDSDYDGVELVPDMIVLPEYPTTVERVEWNMIFPVTFDYRGGVDHQGNEQTHGSVESNKTFLTPTVTREGYTFTGWYYDEACTVPYNEYDRLVKLREYTIYAGWKKNVTVTFDPGDSTFAEAVEPMIVYTGETYGCLPVPKSADHYLFNCWTVIDENGEAGEIVSAGDPVTAEEDHTLMASWTTYGELILDPNGGTVVRSKMSIVYGDAYPRLPSATREGYTFAGWFFGDDTSYAGVQCTTALPVLPEHPNTVYAKWEAVTEAE